MLTFLELFEGIWSEGLMSSGLSEFLFCHSELVYFFLLNFYDLSFLFLLKYDMSFLSDLFLDNWVDTFEIAMFHNSL